MNKIIWVYGIIAGLIMGAMFFITAPFWKSGHINWDNGMWIGYTTMVISLSLIFFAVKSYRDQHLNGVISFGKAFKVGLFITIVASVIYCLSWELAINTVSKGFADEMTAYSVEQKKASAKSAEEVETIVKEAEEFKVMYENPFIRFAFTLMEVFPVGLLISLISAAVLRKREFLPAG